jgi:hypothetical protein
MHSSPRRSLAVLTIAALALLAFAACGPTEKAGDGQMLVFDYEGKFIPVEQLHLSPEDACPASHWHASGQVTTLKKDNLAEPDPECGFGEDGSMPVREVPMPDNYQGIQRTDEEWRFQPRD